MGFRASGIRRIEKSLKTGKFLSPDMEKKKIKFRAFASRAKNPVKVVFNVI